MGRLALGRMLTCHIQFIGHLVAVVTLKKVIQRLVVAGYAAADTGSMSGE